MNAGHRVTAGGEACQVRGWEEGGDRCCIWSHVGGEKKIIKNWREKEREKKVQLPRQIENLFLLDLLRTGHVVQECNHLLRKDEGRQQTSPSCINVTDGWSDRGCLCLHVFMLARMEVLNHWQGGSMKIYTIWQGQVGKKKKKNTSLRVANGLGNYRDL